jgi:DNA-binding LacI/PurR family transcriptional regulator
MRRLGLEQYIMVADGTFTETGGYRGARKLFKQKPTPTAIFAANDLNAIGALNALETMGLRVPEDISLVGYDNTPLAALRHVSLTSVHQPGKDLGRMAVDRLLERIHEGSPKPRHDVVAPSLVVRSTSGPPPENKPFND